MRFQCALLRFRPIFLSILLTIVSPFYGVSSQAELSAYAQQVLPLLPSDASLKEIRPNDELGRGIDELLLRIFQSSSGKIFCGAVREDFEAFRKGFFINDSTAKQAFQLCHGRFSNTFTNKVFPKKYVVVFTEASDFKVDGWTTPHNETFIFVSRTDYDVDRITRTLIHEMAVSYDRKEQIGFGGVVDVPKLGIQSDEDSCASLSILRNAKIKHALSAARAFDIEKRISRELNISLPEGFAAWENLSCQDKMNFLEPYILPLQVSLQAEDLINQLMDQPLCFGKLVHFQNFPQGIQILEQLKFTFSDGKQRNACEYLTEGWPFFPGVSFRGGPQPRIGGGGWKPLSELTHFQTTGGDDARKFSIPEAELRSGGKVDEFTKEKAIQSDDQVRKKAGYDRFERN